MADKLNSVILFAEWKRPLSGLSLEQKGILLDALLDYPDSGDPTFEDPMLFMAWNFISNALHKNEQRYDEIREKRREVGRMGGAPKGNKNAKKQANQAIGCFAYLEQPKQAKQPISISNSKSSSKSSSESSSISKIEADDDDDPLAERFESQIGRLSGPGKIELHGYADRLGTELVVEIINKCSDLGARSWAYVRKALDEAESQGCRSVEEYRQTNPIGGSRAKGTRVDRETPSGNDFLKNAAHRRPLIKKAKEDAPDGQEC